MNEIIQHPLDAHRAALFQYLTHLETTVGEKLVAQWIKLYQQQPKDRAMLSTLNGVPVTQSCSVCEYIAHAKIDMAALLNPNTAAKRPALFSSSKSKSPAPSVRRFEVKTPAPAAPPASASARSESVKRGLDASGVTAAKPASVNGKSGVPHTGTSGHPSRQSWDDVFISQVNNAARTLGSLAIHLRLRNEVLVGVHNTFKQLVPSLDHKTVSSDDPLTQAVGKLLSLCGFQLKSIEPSLIKTIIPLVDSIFVSFGGILPDEAVSSFLGKLLSIAHHPGLITLDAELKQLVDTIIASTRILSVIRFLIEHLHRLKTYWDSKTPRQGDMFFSSEGDALKTYDFFRSRVLKLLNKSIERESVRLRYLYDDMLSPGEYVVPWYDSSTKTMNGLKTLRDLLAQRHSCRRDEVVLVTREGDDLALSGAVHGAENSETETATEVFNPHPFLSAFPNCSEQYSGVAVGSRGGASSTNGNGGDKGSDSAAQDATVAATISDLSSLSPSPHRRDERRSRMALARQFWEVLLMGPDSPDSLKGQHGYVTFALLYILFPAESLLLLAEFGISSPKTLTDLLTKLNPKEHCSVLQPQNFLLLDFPTDDNGTLTFIVEDFNASWDGAKPVVRRAPKVEGGHSSKAGTSVLYESSVITPVGYRAGIHNHSGASVVSRGTGVVMYSAGVNVQKTPTATAKTTFHRTHTAKTYLSIPKAEFQDPMMGGGVEGISSGQSARSGQTGLSRRTARFVD